MEDIRSVVLFLVDSMRPDGLLQADTPCMDRLIAEGAHTFCAKTVFPTMTLPCHASLFFGVDPEVHGITTNTWVGTKKPIPGLFEILFRAGRQSAAFFNWEELRDLHPPGSLKASFYLKDDKTPGNQSDLALAVLATDFFRKNRIDFSFNYFHQTDAAGHREGYMSEPYLKAIANADRCIGKIVDACTQDTVFIVMADHGGIGRSHGTDLPEDTTIPFIMKGPGIPRGYRIERPVKITDVAPTVAKILEVAPPAEWIGEAIVF
jgi:predicted AlkP superfamily pyrophosphatase or phosphodiesterase